LAVFLAKVPAFSYETRLIWSKALDYYSEADEGLDIEESASLAIRFGYWRRMDDVERLTNWI
jgi:hypothetical protein